MKKSLWVFLTLLVVLTGLICVPIWRGGGVQSPTYTLYAMVMMFVPAVASLLTRLICREGFQNLSLAPRFRGHGKYYLAAWLLPAAVTVLGCVVFFLCLPASFDPEMTGLVASLETQRLPMSAQLLVIVELAAAVTVAPLINLIPALGEELGWRGYLLPKLRERMSDGGAIALSGLIWGLWHAPVIAMGHNYGFGYVGAPWLGILTMSFACVLLGAFLSWLFVRTGSAIPCALAHGALNAIANVGVVWVAGSVNPLLGPMVLTWLGGIPMFVLGAWCWHSLTRKDKNETT